MQWWEVSSVVCVAVTPTECSGIFTVLRKLIALSIYIRSLPGYLVCGLELP